MVQQIVKKILLIYTVLIFISIPLFSMQEENEDSDKNDTTFIEIHVKGGEPLKAIKGAEVFVKSEIKDTEFEDTVKTNSLGIAAVNDVPLGKILIQVTSKGWKNYGQRHRLQKENETIQIELQREEE